MCSEGRISASAISSQAIAARAKSNLTPGEIAAIKAMLANPHIPDDVKSPMPKGYE